jgi:chromosome segregation ATPase
MSKTSILDSVQAEPREKGAMALHVGFKLAVDGAARESELIPELQARVAAKMRQAPPTSFVEYQSLRGRIDATRREVDAAERARRKAELVREEALASDAVGEQLAKQLDAAGQRIGDAVAKLTPLQSALAVLQERQEAARGQVERDLWAAQARARGEVMAELERDAANAFAELSSSAPVSRLLTAKMSMGLMGEAFYQRQLQELIDSPPPAPAGTAT